MNSFSKINSKFANQHNLSSEQVFNFDKYIEHLILWNSKINLVGKSTLVNPLRSHILDCLQISNNLNNKKLSIVDLGTGAGLPGLVLSIIGFKNVTLVDSNLKKINFLKFVQKELKLPFVIINDRIEKIKKFKFDIIVSRALAKLNMLFFYSLPLSHKKTKLIFLKGKNIDQEITHAKKNWFFDYELKKSQSDHRGSIIIINNFKKK